MAKADDRQLDLFASPAEEGAAAGEEAPSEEPTGGDEASAEDEAQTEKEAAGEETEEDVISGPRTLGNADIEYRGASQILTKATGFMSDYDFTLNPYSGCAFGCNYCYAAFFSRSADEQENWGHWVRVKENAISLLRKKRSLRDKRIYMSSVTDPYQPIEQRLLMVRSLLEVLLEEKHQPRLVIQTRSPLIVRDIDLLKKFDHLQVNMTVTTDSERVRKAFEPLCPSNEQRLTAISEINRKGIQSMITMTPLLPINDAHSFANRLLKTGVRRFVVQDFHNTTGRFVRGTRKEAEAVIAEMEWTPDHYRNAVSVLSKSLPTLLEGQAGFAPI